MEWKVLEGENQLGEIVNLSAVRPQVIFKHSTRCSISSVAKGRLDRAPEPPEADFYYLDLIRHRALSNKIAEVFRVEHESPQVLLIKDGQCIYHESHLAITMEDIQQQIA